MSKPKSFNYQAEAMQTLSAQFFGEYVSRAELLGALTAFIIAADRLDKIKKLIFYGKGIESLPVLHPEDSIECSDQPWNATEETIAHAVIGIATEAGELAEGLFNGLLNKYNENANAADRAASFDIVNLAEEGGDVLWYIAALAQGTGITIDGMMIANVQKLRHRFPDRFTMYDAQNRDLSGERQILENEMLDRIQPGLSGVATLDSALRDQMVDDELARRQLAQVAHDKQISE